MPITINGTTGISGVDGSAGTPALIGSDADTGLVFAAGQISASLNGSAANVPLVAGSAIATTSGTAIDINTAIPSWVRRITIAYNGVSLSGSAHSIIQLGSGSYTTTGYASTGAYAGTANSAGVASATNGLIAYGGSATNAFTGTMTIVAMGSNLWVASHSGALNTTIGVMGGGLITLGGTLDRLRITSTNGTDTFDAGSITLLYE